MSDRSFNLENPNSVGSLKGQLEDGDVFLNKKVQFYGSYFFGLQRTEHWII